LRGYELHATVPQFGDRFEPVLALASSKDSKSRKSNQALEHRAGFLTSVDNLPAQDHFE